MPDYEPFNISLVPLEDLTIKAVLKPLVKKQKAEDARKAESEVDPKNVEDEEPTDRKAGRRVGTKKARPRRTSGEEKEGEKFFQGNRGAQFGETFE